MKLPLHSLCLGTILLIAVPATTFAQSERPRLPEPSDPQAQVNQPARPTARAIQQAWPDRPVLVSSLPRMLTASEVTGWEVLGSDGERVGTLRDFAINLEDGRIEYAIVRSGGVLGIGARRHAVPFSALEVADDNRHAFTIPVTEDQWKDAPRFDDDTLAALAENEQRRTLANFYQTGAVRRESSSDRPAAPTAAPELRLVSELQGAEIRNQDGVIGRVDAVLLNLRDGDAFVRFGPNPSVVGTNDAYLLLFAQLTADPDDQDRLSTRMAVEDFQRARPTFGTGTAAPAARTTE
jgi:sporulation protein YlmC with PRC-barrel domain